MPVLELAVWIPEKFVNDPLFVEGRLAEETANDPPLAYPFNPEPLSVRVWLPVLAT